MNEQTQLTDVLKEWKITAAGNYSMHVFNAGFL